MAQKELQSAILKDKISITDLFYIMSNYNDKDAILPTAEIIYDDDCS